MLLRGLPRINLLGTPYPSTHSLELLSSDSRLLVEGEQEAMKLKAEKELAEPDYEQLDLATQLELAEILPPSF